MLRTIIAVAASVLLVGVMSVLIVESRAVQEDYYIEHAERMRAVETSKNALATIVEGSQEAFKDGRAVSASIDLAFARLAENNLVLQDSDGRHRQNPAVDATLTSYDGELAKFVADGQAFSEEQNALADALQTLQEESPLAVKDLRRFNLRIQSQNVFSLAIDIIEFATGGDVSAESISTRVTELENDSTIAAQAPGRIAAFTAAATAVVNQRTAAEEGLSGMNSGLINESLGALSNEILSENRLTVGRAERARLLLSVCAILLLIGVGYAMVRLQSSFRDVNRGNRELEKANSSLEDRVNERTEELSSAYNQLKESQVQLVQAEKMSSLGELVAGISHEINTPLWYLMSNSEVLQNHLNDVKAFVTVGENMLDSIKSSSNTKEAIRAGLIEMQKMLKDGMTDDVDEAKDLIKDSIEGLEELTELAQSLKDFSRLDRARSGEFNLHDGLDKTLLIAKNRLKNKVTVHKHYGELPLIHCSPSQINQIFLNLLTNAADAIDESGEIVLQTKSEDDKVFVSISDTGSGIPDDVIAKVRDPFFTTKDVGKGTGLGLSIVDQIVTSHGGELLIESKLGKGTTVTVILPVKDSNATDEEEETAANDPTAVAAAEPSELELAAVADGELPEFAAN